jgi:hypothetical protein
MIQAAQRLSILNMNRLNEIGRVNTGPFCYHNYRKSLN